ncbi:hypothetical protein CJ030_MR7G014406 [Morella rubra]|uniref:Protein kinase domain-containing protein n=1 Tax=Morella rubra TaxID=262757 RepID=A0A6A1V110_9ROSI|nr:hypothetical protein CJ030_MR7G014406 [Morella rubra]
MDVSLEMVISYFFLVVVFLVNLGDGQKYDCPELSCGSSGLPIRFPFRLNSQPEYLCGYPGFNLSCTHRNETVLELPNSVKLFVKKINYVSQVIQLTDAQHCLPGTLRGLDISSSPFQFRNVPEYEYSFDNYTFFSCSLEERKVHDSCIPCLSGPNHQVCAFHSSCSFDYLPNFVPNCTKIYDIPQIPRDIVFGGQNFLELKWFTPACGHCEVQGKKCRLKKNRRKSRTECFPEQSKGASLRLRNVGAIVGSFLLVLLVFVVVRVYRYDKIEKQNQTKIKLFLEDYKNFKPTRYSYADIKRITSGFTEKLGQGTYGTVFKGKLSNEIHVAVKILNPSKGNGEEFINEVGTIGKIHHVNVVRLVGFCADGFRRALVYEFLPNNSLEKFIGSADTNNCFLGWEKLQDIAIGIAKGVEYLHQGCDQRILHFDIKPHNVLLDNNFNPKISDFGLAKLCSKDQSLVSMTTIKGTMGYIAPEVFSRNFGNVSCKADVYSFGMLLLEVVGGRKNTDLTLEKNSQVYFPEWIYNLLEENDDVRLLVEDDGDAEIAKKLAIVGLWCIQWHPMDRPSMKLVVQMLEGEGENLTMPPNPFTSSIGPTRIKASMHPRRVNQELEVIPESE